MDEQEAGLSSVGWHVVETIERMLDLEYSLEDIMECLNLPTEYHIIHLLRRAANERKQLLDDLSE